MPKEDEPRGIIAPLKENIALVALALSPSSIMKQITKMKAMSPPELIIYLLTTAFWITCFFGSCALSILGFLLTLMRGSFGQEEKSAKELELVNSKKKSKFFNSCELTGTLINNNNTFQEGMENLSPRNLLEKLRRMMHKGKNLFLRKEEGVEFNLEKKRGKFLCSFQN